MYYGSGILITRAIEKYGKTKFKREILKEFDTIEEAYEYEASIVNQKFVDRADTYNLRVGGLGTRYSKRSMIGRKWMNKDGQNKIIEKKLVEIYLEDGWKFGRDISEESKRHQRFAVKERYKIVKHPKKGVSPSKETREKLSKSVKGFKHSEEAKLKMKKAWEGRKWSKERNIKVSESSVAIKDEEIIRNIKMDRFVNLMSNKDLFKKYEITNSILQSVVYNKGKFYSKFKYIDDEIEEILKKNGRSMKEFYSDVLFKNSRKIKDEDIREIKRLYCVELKSTVEISKIYGVSTSTIRSVIFGLKKYNRFDYMNEEFLKDTSFEEIKYKISCKAMQKIADSRK